jgi:signal transduction histidine kinase
MRYRGSRWLHLLVLGPLAAALSLVVVVTLHGWLRLGALLLVAAMLVAMELLARAGRRSTIDACSEVVHTHADRTRELSSLQTALAHELKNPLTSIKSLAGLLALEPKSHAERLDKLQSEIRRMQRLLDELLDFSRPLTPLVLESVDLRALLQEVATLHEGLAAAKQIELVVEPTHPVVVRCDPRKVKQIVMNLTHNAIEASPRDETIALCLAVDEERAQVQVLDRGPGLPCDQLARVVEPGVTTKPDGAGLGLTIARALAHQHGGSLELVNRDRGGLAALVDLPRQCPERAYALPGTF